MRGLVRVALIAIVVVFVQVQCVAACAGDACTGAAKRESTPPCHRHHNHSNDQDPALCGHQTLSAPAIPQQAVHVEFPAFVALGAAGSTFAVILTETWGHPLYASNFSPPGIAGLSSVVLRI
jgi:hypothetical protein